MDYELHGIGPAAGAGSAQPRQFAYQQLEFYAFVHFTVNTFTGREWGRRHRGPGDFQPGEAGRPPVGQGGEVRGGCGGLSSPASTTTASACGPAGTRSTRWPTAPIKAQGRHCRETAQACREEGLRFGCTSRPWDRNNSLYGQGKAYDDYFLRPAGGAAHRVW